MRSRIKLGFLISCLLFIFLSCGIVLAYFITSDSGWEQDVHVVSLSLSLNGNPDDNVINSKEDNIKIGERKDLKLEIKNNGQYLTEYQLTFELINQAITSPDGETTIAGSTTANALALAIEVYDSNNKFVGMLNEFVNNIVIDTIAPGETINHDYTLVYSTGASEYFSDKDFVLVVSCAGSMVANFQSVDKYYVNDFATLKQLQRETNWFNDKQIVLLSDITFEEDITFTTNVGLDLNGHQLNLNNFSLNFNSNVTSSNFQRITDSRINDNTASIDNGSIKINSSTSFLMIDESMSKYSSQITVTNFSIDAFKNCLENLMSEENESVQNGQYYFLKNISYYLDSNQVNVYFATEDVDRYGINISTDNIITITEQTQTIVKSFPINFSFSGKDAVVTIDDIPMTVIGTSSEAIATDLLNSIPDTISGALFLRQNIIDSNAYVTWISSNNNIIDSNGVFLKNGYQVLDTYDKTTIELSVIVHHDGSQYYASKTYNVQLLTSEQKTDILYQEHSVSLNETGQIYHLYNDELSLDVVNKTGLVDAKYSFSNIEGNNQFSSTQPYLVLSTDAHQLTLINRPYGVSYQTVFVDITFTYADNEVITVTNQPINVIGYTQTSQVVNPANELQRYLPTTTLYPEFIMPTTTEDGFSITYVVPSEYSAYLTVTDFVDENNVQYKKFTILPAYVPKYDSRIIFDAVIENVPHELSFNIDGIYHESRDIEDSNLYHLLLQNYDVDNDNWLTQTELAATKDVIDLSSSYIKNITGVEALINTKQINLSDNDIININALSQLYNLEQLNLSQNMIADISALEYLDNLINLNLSQNPVSDISPIQYLESLSVLDINNMQLSDFSPVVNMKSLQRLYVYGNSGAISETTAYYFMLLLDSNNTQIYRYGSTNSSSDPYSASDANIALALVLEKVKRIYEAQNTLYVPSTYYYNGTTYYLRWLSYNSDVLNFDSNNIYTFENEIIVDTIVTLGVKIGRTVSEAASTNPLCVRTFDVLFKKSDINKHVYIQLEENAIPIDATTIIPDGVLLSLLFDPVAGVNTITTGGVIVDGVESSIYTEDITISYQELHSNTFKNMNWIGENITDLSGLRYFNDVINAIYFGSNNFIDISELEFMTNLTTLYLDGALFDFDSIANIANHTETSTGNLVNLTVYGSYGLDSTEVETALYHVWKNHPNIKIYKDTPYSDDAESWNPFLIPVTKAIESLQSVYYVKNYGDVVNISEYVDVLMYDDLEATRFNLSYTNGSNITSNDLFYKNNFTASRNILTYTKLAAYADTAYNSVTYSITIGGDSIVIPKTIEIIIEGTDNIFFDDGTSLTEIAAVFPGKVLRQLVFDKVSTSIRNNQIGSSYNIILDSEGNYIVNAAYLSTITASGLRVTGGNSDETYAIKGLEYLTGISTIQLSFFSKINGDYPKYLTNITNLTLDNAVINLGLLTSDQEWASRLTTLIVRNAPFVNLYTDELDSEGNYISVFTYFPNLVELHLHTSNIYSFRALSPYQTTNQLQTLLIYGNNGSTFYSTYQILNDIFYNSTASTQNYRTYNANTLYQPTITAEAETNDQQATWSDVQTSIIDLGITIADNSAPSDTTPYYMYDSQYLITTQSLVTLPTRYYVYQLETLSDTVDRELYYDVTWEIVNNPTLSGQSQPMLSIVGDQLVVNYNLPFDWFFGLKGTVVSKHSASTTRSISYGFTLEGTLPKISDSSTTLQGMEYQTLPSSTTITYNGRTVTYNANTRLYTFTNFEDPTLRAWISLRSRQNGTIPLTSSGLAGNLSLWGVGLNGKIIYSLEGLQLFNVTHISMPTNYIDDITPLINSTSLQRIELYNNFITDISIIQNLENITLLSIGGSTNISGGSVESMSYYDGTKYVSYLEKSFNSVTSILAQGNYNISYHDIEALVKYDESGNYIGPMLSSLYLGSTKDARSIEMYRALAALYTGIASKNASLSVTLSLEQATRVTMTAQELAAVLTNIVQVYDERIAPQMESGLNGLSSTEMISTGTFTVGSYTPSYIFYPKNPTIINSIDSNGTIEFYKNDYRGVYYTEITISFITGLSMDCEYKVKYGTTNEVGTTSAIFVEQADGSTIRLVKGEGDAASEPYIFEDYDLAMYVSSLLTTNSNGIISNSQRTKNFAINIQPGNSLSSTATYSIESLKGIEYFPNITGISVTYSNILEIPVPALTNGVNTRINTINLLGSPTLANIENLQYYQGLVTLNLERCTAVKYTTFEREIIAKLPALRGITLNAMDFDLDFKNGTYNSFGNLNIGGTLFNVEGGKQVTSYHTLAVMIHDYSYFNGPDFISAVLPSVYAHYQMEMITYMTGYGFENYNFGFYSDYVNNAYYRQGSNIALPRILGYTTGSAALKILNNNLYSGETTYLPTVVNYHGYQLNLGYRCGNNASVTATDDGGIYVPTSVTDSTVNIRIQIKSIVYNGVTYTCGRELDAVAFNIVANANVPETSSSQIVDGMIYNTTTQTVEYRNLQLQLTENGEYVSAVDYFEDKALMLYVFNNTGSRGINKNGNTILEYSEISAVTSLSLTRYGTSGTNGFVSNGGTNSGYYHSLEGIQIFFNLQTFILSNSYIADLSPLRTLKLKTFRYNSITTSTTMSVYIADWSFLDNSIDTLEEFSLYGSIVDFRDLGFLQKFANLTRITLYNNSNNKYISTNGFEMFVAWMNINRPNCRIVLSTRSGDDNSTAAYTVRDDYKRAINVFNYYQSTSSITLENGYNLVFNSDSRTGSLASSINYGGQIYDLTYTSLSSYATIGENGEVSYIQDVNGHSRQGHILLSFTIDGVVYSKILTIDITK